MSFEFHKLENGWFHKQHDPKSNERFLIANDLKEFFGIEKLEYRMEGEVLCVRWIDNAKDLSPVGESLFSCSDEVLSKKSDKRVFLIFGRKEVE